jgi:glyoxylase-like metal-dependent hydrolase (beta-lactamase superfamily II)
MTERQPSTSRGRSLSFRQIVNGIFLIDTLGGGIPGRVASYLVKGEQSALIDVGYPTSANTVLHELQALFGGTPRVDFLIPTHVHLDHAGGLGHLAKAMPAARVLVNEHGAKHLVDPTKVIDSATNLFGKEAMSVYGTPLPLPRERIEEVRELCSLDLGAEKMLRILWTPGHAWHHMSVLLENERLLVTGDAVALHYPGFNLAIPATPPPGFDEERYVKTLTEFMGMDLVGLLLPHFGPVLENVGAFLQTNLETVRRWASEAFEAVKSGEPLERVFEGFLVDVADRSGRARDEIPEHVVSNIRLSTMGCISYAQERIAKE